MTAPLQPNDPRAVIDADRAHVWHHMTQHAPFVDGDPKIIVEGRGMKLWDITGKEHLDALSGGVWTVNVGYGRERIGDAVRDQIVRMNFFGGNLGSIPAARFSQRLVEKTPGLSRVYYANSGSEANEKAFKIVRQIAHKRHGGRKSRILYRDRDYHGTTIGCLSAGGQDERNAQYGPFAPDFVRVPHCLEYRRDELGLGHLAGADFGIAAADLIEQVIRREGPDTIGALCLETVTAGGGVIPPPEGYLERVQEICRRHGILLVMDEVVCGFGRTGTWFGYQHHDIAPDIVTMAKGMASGYAAISACVTTEAVFEMFRDDSDDPLNHFRDISTFGGCTAGPAAALENMAIIEEEDLLANTCAMSERLMGNLHALAERHAAIGDVRGKGLFCGAEMVADRETKAALPEAQMAAILRDCMDRGVIVGGTNRSVPGRNNTLCLSPALIATPDDIDHITDTLDGALSRVLG